MWPRIFNYILLQMIIKIWSYKFVDEIHPYMIMILHFCKIAPFMRMEPFIRMTLLEAGATLVPGVHSGSGLCVIVLYVIYALRCTLKSTCTSIFLFPFSTSDTKLSGSFVPWSFICKCCMTS